MIMAKVESQKSKVKIGQSLNSSFFSIMLFVILLVHGSSLVAQQSTINNQQATANKLKKNNQIIKTMLDYRYKGGSGAFERDFFINVDYNKISRQSCTIGTTIMQFTVGCDGSLGEFNIINPLNDHINSQLHKFFLMTQGNWNECQNSDYEYFEIPIVFTIEGVETEAIGLISNIDEQDGCPCKDDSYFHEEFQRYKDKKPKKALNAINELIKRNPYNESYIEEKNKLVEKSEKLKN